MLVETGEFPAAVPSLSGWQQGRYAEESSVSEPLGSRTRQGEAADRDVSSKQAAPEDELELSPEAQQQLTKLKERDRGVKAHEAAHIAAGGSLVRGGAMYTYQQGPDGKRYAVGGEVSLDASEVPNNPRATITKAQRLRAAALAPAEPSGQDRAVAAQAANMASKAAMELAKQQGAPAESRGIGSNVDTTG